MESTTLDYYPKVFGTTLETPENKTSESKNYKSYTKELTSYSTGSIQYIKKDFSNTEIKENQKEYPIIINRPIIPELNIVATLYGDVEKIENDIALVQVKIDDDYEERIFSVDKLAKIKANFAGAKIKIIISEDSNSVTTTTKIEKSNNEEPLWASPDEDMIRILSKLKK